METNVLVHGGSKINNAKYQVSADLNKPEVCGKCSESIYWATTRKAKRMPIEYSRERGGYISHYDNCTKKLKSGFFISVLTVFMIIYIYFDYVLALLSSIQHFFPYYHT